MEVTTTTPGHFCPNREAGTEGVNKNVSGPPAEDEFEFGGGNQGRLAGIIGWEYGLDGGNRRTPRMFRTHVA